MRYVFRALFLVLALILVGCESIAPVDPAAASVVPPTLTPPPTATKPPTPVSTATPKSNWRSAISVAAGDQFEVQGIGIFQVEETSTHNMLITLVKWDLSKPDYATEVFFESCKDLEQTLGNLGAYVLGPKDYVNCKEGVVWVVGQKQGSSRWNLRTLDGQPRLRLVQL